MRSLVAAALKALAFRLDDSPVPVVISPVKIRDVFVRPPAKDVRQQAALSLMDDECIGFLLVEVREDPDDDADVCLSVQAAVDDTAWPAMSATLAMIRDEIHDGE